LDEGNDGDIPKVLLLDKGGESTKQDYGRPDSRQRPKAIHGLVSEGGAENGDVEALFRQEDVVFLITIVSR